MRKRTRFIYNTALLTASTLVMRCIGCAFQVWLAGRIGSAGIGLYQLMGSVGGLAVTFAVSGIGFGTMFPAYNTLFVNLAPNSKRGTATSTYLTSWDVGIGIGMLVGGSIAEVSSLSYGYLLGAMLTLVSLVYYNRVVAPHFMKNKLR